MHTQHPKQQWIIGCGNIGQRVARLYQKQGIQTRATVQSKESLALCQQQKIDAISLNLDNSEMATAILASQDFKQTNVFYFIPPPAIGTVDLRLQCFLEYFEKHNTNNIPKRLVLISTTGVYGDCKGAWIDETQPTNPTADRAKRRLDAEQRLIQWCQQQHVEWVILRVPGIYALDRLPLARLKQNLPILAAAEAPFTNRIHADDLAMICKTAMQDSASGEIYNVTDNQPSTMTDYFNAVADYAKLPRPPQVSREKANDVMSAGMLSYLQESRRINNKKLIQTLKIKLRYPTLADALKK